MYVAQKLMQCASVGAKGSMHMHKTCTGLPDCGYNVTLTARSSYTPPLPLPFESRPVVDAALEYSRAATLHAVAIKLFQ